MENTFKSSVFGGFNRDDVIRYIEKTALESKQQLEALEQESDGLCRENAELRDKLAAVYTQQTGKTPKIEAIHAGLECGLFAGQLPGLDCVSFGPDLADIHTTREKMSISSVQRTWRFLLGALEALKD